MSRSDAGDTTNQGMAGQLKDKAGEMASNIRDTASQLRDQAAEQFQSARETATEYYEAGREKASQWEQEVETFVRDQPLKALAIAAGVGLVLGVIWKRI